MEEIRLYCRGQPRGTVTLDRGDSRREVEAAMADPGDGLYRAFLVGEKGELPLGVMEPDRGRLTARRRIYARDIAALGPLRRGEARMSFRFGESVWQEVRDPGQLVSVPELRQRLEKVPRAFRRREGERLLLAFPLGVATAVYLHEYAGNTPFARMVRLGVNNLAGVPSVVFGLFGLSFFVTFCGMGVSILSGILTLAVLTLPVIISTAEESLRSVPDTYRQASLALGAGKAQTITRVVLPCAMPGMLTGAILGVARAAGETAAIMFTAAVFYTPKNPDSIFSSVMALPYHMYVLATAGTDIEKTRPLQYGTGLVLILLVLGMNLLAIILRDHLQRRHHA